jgi:NTE family protein
LAHIGVLRVLEREEIPIHHLAGTSMGGVVAAAHATGFSPAEMEAEALLMRQPRQLLTLLDRRPPEGGIFRGRALEDYLARQFGDLTFDQVSIPLALLAVDLRREEKVILQQGRVRDAVRASVAFPGVFAPVDRGDQLLVDGGLLNNLPADVVRQMGADVVIAVDVSTDAEVVNLMTKKLYGQPLVPSSLVSIVEVLWRSVQVMMHEIDRRCLQVAETDLVVQPAIPPQVTVFTGFDRAADVIAAGEAAMTTAMPRLQALLHGV